MRQFTNHFKYVIFLLLPISAMSIISGCSKSDIESSIPVISNNTDQGQMKAAQAATTKTATTEALLRNYISTANPGDVIQISGTINISQGCLITAVAGTSSALITIEGINSGKLNFTAIADRACLNIKHNYYRIKNLTIDANSNSKRGLLIEDADHGKATYVNVKETLNEAFKIRKNSEYWYFDHCTVTDAGMDGQYGEGFYCGDANANWTTGSVADKTGYLAFNYCTVYAYADGFDCKEGTHHIKIVNCTVDWNSGNVDTQFGNHGISTRCDNFQAINCTVKNNTKGVGKCVWAGSLQAKDGIWYGKNVEIKKLTGYNMAQYGYWTSISTTTLYTDYSITQCAGVKDPSSTYTAASGSPSNFTQMTWIGEGGGTY